MATLSQRLARRSILSRPKKLICFYCNHADLFRVQDGSVRQWECRSCQSMNYYDENGEITDPPTEAVVASAPARFARTIPRPASPLSVAPPSDNVFCETCLKNQHLYTTSLAQYEAPEQHPRDRDAEARENEAYERFKIEAEARYPQVCEQCEPAVLERMRRGRYLAQSDNMGRRMAMLRARSAQANTPRSTRQLSKCIQLVWWTGWCAVMAWNLWQGSRTLVGDCVPEDEMIPNLLCYVLPFGNNSRAEDSTWLGRWGLILTVLAFSATCLLCLFCPLRLGKGGLWNGFHALWFSIQALALRLMGLRVPTYALLDDRLQILAIVSSILIAAVDPPLTQKFVPAFRQAARFGTTPTRIESPRRDKSEKTAVGKSNLKLALESLVTSKSSTTMSESSNIFNPPRGMRGATPQEVDLPLDRLQVQLPSKITQAKKVEPVVVDTFASKMSEDEFLQYMTTGELPAYMVQEPMDWERPDEQFRAASRRPPPRDPTPPPPPVPYKPAFYTRLPPAPITPAHRLYNPPTRPRFEPPSEIRKENFFKHTPQEAQPSVTDAEPVFRQQTLFFPEKDDALGGLADSFNVFDLDRTRDERTGLTEQETWRMHEDAEQRRRQNRHVLGYLAGGASAAAVVAIAYFAA